MDRVRYSSLSSAHYLFQQQHRVMTEVFGDDVLFLDVWQASYLSPHRLVAGNAAHYDQRQNRNFMKLFFGGELVPLRGNASANH